MGAQGPPGPQGPVGKAGKDGEQGPRGIGIKTINISETAGNANLTVTLTDDTVIPLGNIRGPRGADGAVRWGDLNDTLKNELKRELQSSLTNIVTELNTKANDIFTPDTTPSQFKSKLKEFIISQLNAEGRANIETVNGITNLKSTQTGLLATDTDFRKWLDAYHKGTSLYCSNGVCETPDKKITLGYYGADGSGDYDKEVRLYTKTGTNNPRFGLGIKDGNIRTDGSLTANVIKSRGGNWLTLESGSGNATAILKGDELVVNNGNIRANTLQLPNGWAIDTDGISLRILRNGDAKFIIFNEGKIWAKTGYGVRNKTGSRFLFTSNWETGNLGVSRDITEWPNEDRGNVRDL